MLKKINNGERQFTIFLTLTVLVEIVKNRAVALT